MEGKKGVKAEVGIDSHMIQKLLRLFQDLVDLKCCNDVMPLIAPNFLTCTYCSPRQYRLYMLVSFKK